METKSESTKEIKNEKNENSSEIKDVKDTPFTIMRNEEGYIVTIKGVKIARKTFRTYIDAKKFIDKKEWELIINTTLFLAENIYNLKQK